MPRTLQPSEQSNSLTMNFMINAHCTCVRETLVCIRKTATRHKRGEGNRSDRNLKATSKCRKNKEIEKKQKR